MYKLIVLIYYFFLYKITYLYLINLFIITYIVLYVNFMTRFLNFNNPVMKFYTIISNGMSDISIGYKNL